MKKTLKLLTLIAIFLVLPLFASARRISSSLVQFQGNVLIDGKPAKVGTPIAVSANGQELNSGVVKEAGVYSIGIRGNVDEGDLLSFTVDGKPVTENASEFKMVDSGATYNLAVESGQVKDSTDVNVVDGDIIQCKSSANPNAVYIVKVVNGKKYIRHIVSLQIFNSYRHLKWDKLIQVPSLDGYILSGWVRVTTGANGAPGQKDRVYEINGDQTRHWVDMTAAEFLQHGGSDEAIFNINPSEMALYKEGPAVKLK